MSEKSDKKAADAAVLEAANEEAKARVAATKAEKKAMELGVAPRYPEQDGDYPQDPQPPRGSNIVPDPVDPRNPPVEPKKARVVAPTPSRTEKRSKR